MRGPCGKRRALLQGKEPERRTGDERKRGQHAAHTRAPAAGRQRDDRNQGRDENKLEEKEQRLHRRIRLHCGDAIVAW